MTSEFYLVSKAGVVQNMLELFIKKFIEFINENRTWHVKWEVQQKLCIYLGANGIHQKCVKFGCKGFVQNQKEAEILKRGSCCQGAKFGALGRYPGPVNKNNLYTKIKHIKPENINA